MVLATWHFLSQIKFKKTNVVSAIRKTRELISAPKWTLAYQVINKLARIPTIQAVFVTGSLSMSNCQESDDIDLMLITTPYTLWLTRALVVVYLSLKKLRRNRVTRNRICDNLYLETGSLSLSNRSLFVAHELLQAKCLFDRSSVHKQLLLANPWVQSYLPVAYSETLKKLPSPLFIYSSYFYLAPANLVAYIFQYLIMRHKITSEKIGLNFAFFHPRVMINTYGQ